MKVNKMQRDKREDENECVVLNYCIFNNDRCHKNTGKVFNKYRIFPLIFSLQD